MDGYLEGADGGGDDDDEGDWTDEEGEDDVPPNFDDEDDDSVKIGLSPSSSPRKKKDLTPVFPDGTPREKW